jgi:rare lipoprotein A
MLALGTGAFGQEQHGKASWYSTNSKDGAKTASGKTLNNHESTAAHKTLPFGTIVKVTNKKNGKSENVVITDRGPFFKDRIIDVTVGVAERLGFKKHGVVPVKIEVVKLGKKNKKAK